MLKSTAECIIGRGKSYATNQDAIDSSNHHRLDIDMTSISRLMSTRYRFLGQISIEWTQNCDIEINSDMLIVGWGNAAPLRFTPAPASKSPRAVPLRYRSTAPGGGRRGCYAVTQSRPRLSGRRGPKSRTKGEQHRAGPGADPGMTFVGGGGGSIYRRLPISSRSRGSGRTGKTKV